VSIVCCLRSAAGSVEVNYGSSIRRRERIGEMAGNTMDAIRKKMQMMRVEKEAARDKAERFEQKLMLQRALNEQVQYDTN